ncbi:MAG TPA: hypothetical protein VHE99_01135 [Gammaproteobacteria bacterium]|nr:hypothetical protein [Gammaproteobacteria bacterium]
MNILEEKDKKNTKFDSLPLGKQYAFLLNKYQYWKNLYLDIDPSFTDSTMKLAEILTHYSILKKQLSELYGRTTGIWNIRLKKNIYDLLVVITADISTIESTKQKSKENPKLLAEEKLEPASDMKEAKSTAEPNFRINEIPAGPLSNIFNYFSPSELAHQASVSKNYLRKANEAELKAPSPYASQIIDFDPGRNAELDSLIASLASKLSSFHMALLHSDPPGEASLLKTNMRRVFLQIRGEILAGRISIKDCIEDINELLALEAPEQIIAFLRSDSLLAKALLRGLESWKLSLLEAGFSFLDLFATWVSPAHAEAITKGWTVEELRELNKHQAMGLVAGFSLDQVRADWFAPIHLEAREYMLAHQIEILNVNVQAILRNILHTLLLREIPEGDITSAEWRQLFNTTIEETEFNQRTPLYIIVSKGHTRLLSLMCDVGEYTADDLRIAVSTPVPLGKTPIFAAVLFGRHEMLEMICERCYTPERLRMTIATIADMPNRVSPVFIAATEGYHLVLDTIYRRGGYTPKTWREILNAAVVFSPPYTGQTPLYIAADQGHAEVLAKMYQRGGYTPETWRRAINTPLSVGDRQGDTPLYIAIIKNQQQALDVMYQLGNYTPETWRAMLNTPLPYSPYRWKTPLYIVADQGHAEVLAEIYRRGSYTPESWRTAINTPLTQGEQSGETALYAAIIGNQQQTLDVMYQLGNYTPETWRAMLNTPLTHGPNTGQTPLHIAADLGNVGVLAEMYRRGGYTPETWRTAINTPLTLGGRKGETPLYAAASSKLIQALNIIYHLGDYTSESWLEVLNFPLNVRGWKQSPLQAFLLRASPAQERTMKQMCEYTDKEWEKVNPLARKALYWLADGFFGVLSNPGLADSKENETSVTKSMDSKRIG